MAQGVSVVEESSDPFQRHFTFYNDTPVTIWPVFQAPQSDNCTVNVPGSTLLRLHVNKDARDAGIPRGERVTVALPKTWPCDKGGFYKAVRIFVFVTDAPKFEEKLIERKQDNQVTKPYTAGLTTPICGATLASDPCWTGTAEAAYPLDSPAQLLEYTIISQNAKGEPNPNPNDATGTSFLDFDVSYVDEAYLTAAMTIDTGAVQFMGSHLSYQQFQAKLKQFLEQTKWPQWGAYSSLNLNAEKGSTVFFGLLQENNNANTNPRVPSAHQATALTSNGGLSVFFDAKRHGDYSNLCVDPAKKANLQCAEALPDNEFCCPNENGIMLGCCDQLNYIIDTVLGSYNPQTKIQRFSSDVLKDLTRRFTRWTDPTSPNFISCKVNPPVASEVNSSLQTEFCEAFKRTVNFVWDEFAQQDAHSANPECAPLARTKDLYNECLTATVIGYKIDVDQANRFKNSCKTEVCQDGYDNPALCPEFCTKEKILNESVQAILRGVPWTSIAGQAACGTCPPISTGECPFAKLGQCVWEKPEDIAADARLYHTNKFLHFWPPYDNPYNLNPYARVIHDKNGLDAPGAYSFSIDDFYGNFGGPGSNLLIVVGNADYPAPNRHLPNPEPYDPYTQYHVAVGEGWHHMRQCIDPDAVIPNGLRPGDLGGRLVNIPPDASTGRGIARGVPFSFYLPDGARRDPCVVAVFETADESRYVTYQLSEATYNVTDTLTSSQHEVKGLSGVAAVRAPGQEVPKDTFCASHSTLDLVNRGKCTGNLAPVGRGVRDGYSNVVETCTYPDQQLDAKCGRPLRDLAVPALP
jgi:hypothetical protein